MGFFLCTEIGFEHSKCNSPADCCLPPAGRQQLLTLCPMGTMAPNPMIHPRKGTRLDPISSLVFLFYVGMMPGMGYCSNFFRCIGFGGGKMPCQIGE